MIGESGASAKLAQLSEISDHRAADTMEQVLSAVKEELGMEVAFIAEFTQERLLFRKLAGEAESFGWAEGKGIPLEETYCRLLTQGRLSNVVSDAKHDERVRNLSVTTAADIGAYVGVPICFSDGSIYGTLCALSHSSDPSLRDRDVRFMKVLARLVAEQVERSRLRMREAAARVRSRERRLIGRELHDRVAHTMAVVHQSLQLHEALSESDPERAAEKLELAKKMAVEAMAKTRDLSRALSTDEAAEGMEEALSTLLRDTVPPGMESELCFEGEEDSVPAEMREQLFLLMREALRNAVRHSGAEGVSVTVRFGEAVVEAVVEDDGAGFDPESTEGPGGGLAYMAERAALLGGGVTVRSTPGDGTRVEAQFSRNGV